MKNKKASAALYKECAVSAELCGAMLSEAAARMLADDLAQYPEHQVIGALADCRRGLQRGERFGVTAVLARLKDGRPGADEAWSQIPTDENRTVIWTDEMSAAWGIAKPLIDDGDTFGARRAFVQAYDRLVSDARAEGKPVAVSVSLGHDKSGREQAVLDAVRRNLISETYALALIPSKSVPAALRLVQQAGLKKLSIYDFPTPQEKIHE